MGEFFAHPLVAKMGLGHYHHHDIDHGTLSQLKSSKWKIMD
jgi:hypothetical protein